MKVNWISEPWEHFEVEDFVSPEQLSDLRDYFKTLSVPDGVTPLNYNPDITKYRHNYYINSGNEKLDPISAMLQQRFIKLLKTVHEWSSAKYEIHIEYDRIYPGFEWKIHNDLDTKVVSYILHVSDKGHGTRLYENSDGSGSKRTVKWIPGGGGGFVRQDNSHHSFDTLEDSTIRNTVILTSRIKESK